MTIEELDDLFEKHQEEYLEFGRIENPLHERADLAAFLRVAQLVPGPADILGYAGHDEVYLSVAIDGVLGIITEGDVIYLLRCGVTMFNDSFHMFV